MERSEGSCSVFTGSGELLPLQVNPHSQLGQDWPPQWEKSLVYQWWGHHLSLPLPPSPLSAKRGIEVKITSFIARSTSFGMVWFLVKYIHPTDMHLCPQYVQKYVKPCRSFRNDVGMDLHRQ